MKRSILILLACISLIGCREKFPFTSDSKKKEIYETMTNFENEEKAEKAGEEFKKITTELQQRAYSGDDKAIKELERWEKVISQIN